MRRPRSKLQVSMFPFLAVLLCVMGALLLLLFQMDRRGKIAAQHKVAAMKSERLARTKAEEDARKAEWERAKQALHQSLLTEQGQLDSQAKDLVANVTEANKKLDLVQTKHLDVKQKIEAESDKIALLQVEIANQQDGVKSSVKKESASKTELLEAAKELADLELAFKKLRERKADEKATYSLVPYRGKHGDTRPPIYVECIGEGILFHPEKKLLAGLDFNAVNVRSEVENRTGPLAIEKASKDKMRPPTEAKSGPYVLFLVRPDGIANYYKAQSSLKGYQLDFGYELVDQHWALDFNNAPNAPPLHQAKSNAPPKVNSPGLPLLPVSPPPNVGQSGNQVSPPNSIQRPGSGVGNAGPMSAPPQSLTSGTIPLGPPPLPALNPSVGMGSVAPPFSSQAPGRLASNVPLMGTPSPLIGNNTYANASTTINVKAPAFVPISRMGAPIPVATTGNNAMTGAPNGVASPNSSVQSGVASTHRPTGGSPSEVSPINVPIPGNSVGAPQRPSNPGDPEVSDVPSDPTAKPVPSFGVEPTKKPAPAPPVGRVLGNKDFVITIDCYADRVSVFPGGMTFRWTAANMKATDQALVQGIANLIAKRQASVRAGEPPYRPVIRFQVSAEGLRSYYHAYPLLDSLGVPMRRENVDE